MKDVLRRIGALALTMAMALSLLGAPGTALTASAEEGGVSAPETASTTPETTAANPNRPTLYIDFLGDDAMPSASGTPVTPAQTDQSQEQSGGYWEKYAADSDVGKIFWVGVGMDKMSLMELSKDGRGLYSLELGFYYNSAFVEPYTGADYKTTLEQYNLGSQSANQWDNAYYDIIEAIPQMDMVTEPDTQESASLSGVDGSWDMLYVSLEKTADRGNAATNRFADVTGDADGTTYYVMMLPFVLKAVDPEAKICFRLSRNASVFTMGGGEYGYTAYGEENGTSTFGAWERVTRTPGHNLKEMLAFEGDLNIFTGKNAPDGTYDARLNLNTSGGGNTAVLYPTADPGNQALGPNGVLSGLHQGDSVTLELTVASNSTVQVTITQDDGTSTNVTYTGPSGSGAVGDPQKYEFVMPASDVVVTVEFTVTPDPDPDDTFRAYLTTVDPDSVSGNTATIADDDEGPGPGPVTAVMGETITVRVSTHMDYKARVEAWTLTGNPVSVTTSVDEEGVYTFAMPGADVEVTVTYEKADCFDARLAIDADSAGSADNRARLWYADSSAVEHGVILNGQTGGDFPIQGGVPEGRQVTLDVACHSDYVVLEVRIYDWRDTSGGTYETLTLQPKTTGDTAGYQQTVSFTMPSHDVLVNVFFAKNVNYTVTL